MPSTMEHHDHDSSAASRALDALVEASLTRDLERRLADRTQASRGMMSVLEDAAGPDTLLIHDRVGPAGHLAHLAIAPSGVWVIEARRFDGCRVDVLFTGGSAEEDRERLVVAGRDKTMLVRGLQAQHEAVAAALRAYDVPVRGIFCILGGQLPSVWTPEIQGFLVGDAGLLAQHLCADGPLDRTLRRGLRGVLSGAFPAR